MPRPDAKASPPADAEAFSDKDRRRAKKCLDCRICSYARRKQRGVVFWLIKVENHICPYARAYRRVYGRGPLDPVDEQ